MKTAWKCQVVFTVLTALLWLIPGIALSQLQLQGGSPTLVINSAVAGSEPIAVVNTATTVRFKREAVLTKVTVRTACTGQKFNLSVVAIAVSAGTPAPLVSLVNGMLDRDFITGIPPKPPNAFENATLSYTASATFAQGNSTELGNDVHTVSFTLVAQ